MRRSFRPRVPLALVGLALLLLGPATRLRADEEAARPPDPAARRSAALAWLAAHANEDGSYGRAYTVAITSLAVLARMAAVDEPFEGEGGKPLLRGVQWLLAAAKDGAFPLQGHTWIHGQGFATLALSEAYARALRAKKRPDLDLERIRATVASAVKSIEANQSASGGWWYTPGSPGRHEGSTTVCAVQALVSAANHGIPTDAAVLAKGFEYLKRCQNPDGGFDYMEGPGTASMVEGTAADVATLALMRKFDFDVMVNGVDYLKKAGPEGISKERFPYYGQFYAVMGLVLFGEEMGAEEAARAWSKGATAGLLAWQSEDGSFPLRGWMTQGTGEVGPAYSTAFAVLVLSVPDKRLSVFQRSPPPLPAAPR